MIWSSSYAKREVVGSSPVKCFFISECGEIGKHGGEEKILSFVTSKKSVVDMKYFD